MLRQLASFVSSNVARHNQKATTRLTPTTSFSGGWMRRPLSTTSHLSTPSSNNQEEEEAAPTITIETQDGRKFAILDSRKLPKLKPSIVKRRLSRLKTFVETEKDIRHSPWRMNLICQMIAGLPVQEAFLQLQFCEKSRAPLLSKVLKRVVETAEREDNLQPSQLEVAECFTTKGKPLKRLKIMGRGRTGRMSRQFSHIRLIVREIDFKLRIYQQKTIKEKKKWLHLQLQAEKDAQVAAIEKEELEKLEAQQKELEEQEKEEGKQ